MDVGRRRVTVVRQHPTHAAELHHLRHLGGLQRAVPTDQRTRSGDPVEGGSCNDYDYVRDDSATSFDLDGEECFSCIGRKVVGAGRSVARAARRVAESSAFQTVAGAAVCAASGPACFAMSTAILDWHRARCCRRSPTNSRQEPWGIGDHSGEPLWPTGSRHGRCSILRSAFRTNLLRGGVFSAGRYAACGQWRTTC